MKRILKRAHSLVYQGFVILVFFLLWPLFYYYSRKPERYPVLNKLRGRVSFVSSALAGIFYKFHFETKIDWSRTYIICPNHTSNLDINAQNILIKNNYAFLGKDELLDNPVTRIFFKTVDIPVNRESNISSFRAFKKAEERLKNGTTMVIFPEGAIADHYPPQLIPFKNGPFRLAIALKIPIIPVTSPDIWKVLWDSGDQLGSRPGVCNIYIHKPIETAHLTIDDADKLKDEVYSLMKHKLENEI
ncbi:1-acyl-sn-glycerol-3-phosphate acyltransferase [Mucilaginibacter yixingensis]|uniref:1-acyl-sn-glycerol-3-phosphate acyltransferase n=1 Tax=Mucilaginibacter yixingensis TaxID=1295612 RepID=A0A2T5JG15_9SPHI|nr:lysophospholipid acyltransferase family protein [Mucilaginibacter yixingensis]PTR01373.1 1-acyl-sn-glycerol-3-phosphate acyltransferase [Mucilaginibacter yixingensis]